MNNFYTSIQNNSGGYYIENEDVASAVIIEAADRESALEKLDEITEDYHEYCECCGPRWEEYWVDEIGSPVPEIFGTTLDQVTRSVIVYYSDGRKVKVNY